VFRAAQDTLMQLTDRAAQALQVTPEEIVYRDRTFSVKDNSEQTITLAALAQANARQAPGPIIGRGTVNNLATAPSVAAHIAEVEFDPDNPETLTFAVPMRRPGLVRLTVQNTDGRSSSPVELTILPPTAQFIRGDANIDAAVDISDAVKVVRYLFSDVTVSCLDAADTNDDEEINITAAIFLLEFLYRGGSAPPAPFPEMGSDPGEADALGCEDGLDPFGGNHEKPHRRNQNTLPRSHTPTGRTKGTSPPSPNRCMAHRPKRNIRWNEKLKTVTLCFRASTCAGFL